MEFPDEIPLSELSTVGKELLLAGYEMEMNVVEKSTNGVLKDNDKVLWVQKPTMCEDLSNCVVYMAYVQRGDKFVFNAEWAAVYGLPCEDSRSPRNIWVPK